MTKKEQEREDDLVHAVTLWNKIYHEGYAPNVLSGNQMLYGMLSNGSITPYTYTQVVNRVLNDADVPMSVNIKNAAHFAQGKKGKAIEDKIVTEEFSNGVKVSYVPLPDHYFQDGDDAIENVES